MAARAAAVASLLLLAACLALAAPDLGYEPGDLECAEALRALFARWQAKHHPHAYAANELSYRFKVFSDNVRFIHSHNTEPGITYRLAVNKFADLTREEFSAKHYGLNVGLRRPALKTSGGAPFRHAAVKPPKARDWRKLGAVTPVKNQGFCGSCWAFSTTGAIEGINAIVTGKLVSLSEQELVDCDQKRDHGCNGGLMDFAFEFVIQNGGLDTEEDYTYNATENACKLEKMNTHAVTIDDYEDVPENSEKALLKAVAAQPVSVAIEADEMVFQFYSDGIIMSRCGTDLDHGVLAVGYGTFKGVDYWIVKNSWGPDWGEGGYVRIRRNVLAKEGMCGIAMMASYPVKIEDAELSAVTQVEKTGKGSLLTRKMGAGAVADD